MPYVEPNGIDAIRKKADREKLAKLLQERAVLAYAFSWGRLIERIKVLAPKASEADVVSALFNSVAAFTDDQAKELKAELNEKIADLFTEYDQKTIRHVDPFGRQKDFIMQEGTSTSCPQKRVMEVAVSKYGLNADKLAKAFEDATERKKFVTVQARDVRIVEDAE